MIASYDNVGVHFIWSGVKNNVMAVTGLQNFLQPACTLVENSLLYEKVTATSVPGTV